MNRKLFTIVELLVVIGIIAILSALIFPALGKSRDRAKKTACQGNLRQLGTALNIYADNNMAFLPPCRAIGDSPDDPACFANMLDIQTRKIFACPSDSEEKYDGLSFSGKHGSSYEWNPWANGNSIDKSSIEFQSMYFSVPLLFDADKFHGSMGNNYLFADGSVAEKLDINVQ